MFGVQNNGIDAVITGLTASKSYSVFALGMKGSVPLAVRSWFESRGDEEESIVMPR